MRHIVLTRHSDRAKTLVNMGLISEVVRISDSRTRLIVPMAVTEDARYIDVLETPEQIAALV